jgi:penicillin amidase
MIGIAQSAFAPFTAVDVLAIARFQALNLSYDVDSEIAATDFVEAVRSKFNATATDPAHQKRAGILVDVMRFAPVEPTTMIDGFPNDAQNTMALPQAPLPSRATPFRADRAPLAASRGFREALKDVRRLIGGKEDGFTGSNNWVVGPSRSATSHPMIASDPHLGLSAPAVFWLTHVTVDSPKPEENIDIAGIGFPGIPGVILGFNKDVAWGSTTANYDVSDVYEETLAPDGNGVLYRGQNVPFERVHETILVSAGAPVEYDVLIVPHHGPVVPTITSDHKVGPLGQRVLSSRWTGHAPTKDLDAVFGLWRAKTVDDARVALKSFAIGAQNWVVADTKGDIFFTSQSQIPKRDKAAFTWDPATFTGRIPCFVLPGDGTAEWTGQMLEESYVPHAKNPAKGFIATANNEQVGNNVDNDPTNDKLPNGEPFFTTAWHDLGFRAHRITQRIEAKPKLSLEDMSSIQGDTRSAAGWKLTPAILATLEHAAQEAAAPGSRPDIAALVASPRYTGAGIAEIRDLLTRWGSEADYDAASGMDADNQPVADAKQAMASRATSVFNAWFARMFQATFADEIKAIGSGFAIDRRRALFAVMLQSPQSMKTYDATLGDSILFDDLDTPAVVETRDERVLLSLLDAIEFLRGRLGPDTNGWQWGKLHTIRFNSLVSLWGTYSIPSTTDAKFPKGFPRGGDGLNVDVASYGLPSVLDANASFAYGSGPTQRFVIDMDPAGVRARNALPGGNVWDPSNAHFRDQAELWRRNQTFDVAFRAADVVSQAEDRIVYETR